MLLIPVIINDIHLHSLGSMVGSTGMLEHLLLLVVVVVVVVVDKVQGQGDEA